MKALCSDSMAVEPCASTCRFPQKMIDIPHQIHQLRQREAAAAGQHQAVPASGVPTSAAGQTCCHSMMSDLFFTVSGSMCGKNLSAIQNNLSHIYESILKIVSEAHRPSLVIISSCLGGPTKNTETTGTQVDEADTFPMNVEELPSPEEPKHHIFSPPQSSDQRRATYQSKGHDRSAKHEKAEAEVAVETTENKQTLPEEQSKTVEKENHEFTESDQEANGFQTDKILIFLNMN